MELASNGLGNVAPNPLVGCVIVYNDKIIGEGFHQKNGEAHAEVNAINSVKDKSLLKHSTLYVNLEPCSHWGKTPPCADKIIKSEIKNVVVGSIDCFPEVCSKGIDKLKHAGVNVEVGVLENECKELNKRFFKFYDYKRPYIFLKWAPTSDGFMDIVRTPENRGAPFWISNEITKSIVHKWRSEEQAIIVGKNTALNDNPMLTVRDWSGKSPLRIVLDRKLSLPTNLNLFNNSTPTLVFTDVYRKNDDNIEFVIIDNSISITKQICNELFKRKIQSLIVEGGKILLEAFINDDLWDEACILVGNNKLINGLKAPKLNGDLILRNTIQSDTFYFYKNILSK